MRLQILIIDDEPAVRQVLSAHLGKLGHVVDQAANGADALAKLKSDDVDVAICDICLPDFSGIEVLRRTRGAGIDTAFIMITAFASLDSAIEAMKSGASDYIVKPVHEEELLHRVKQVDSLKSMHEENRMLRNLLMKEEEQYYHFDSDVMRKIERLVGKVAPADATVLITGESGTGKGIIARAIHGQSRRAHALFLAINCGAIPDNLIESELFGHTRGAFTGADKARKGLFLQGDGGTVFLDEIGDLPLHVQSKLLHALEEKQVRAVGSERTRHVDVRIVAATNWDLTKMVAEGKFRADLYYRLGALHIHVPPLRERRGDIPALFRFLLASGMKQYGSAPVPTVDPLVDDVLMQYSWPGNVRELKNVAERVLIMAEGDHVRVSDLPPDITKVSRVADSSDEPCHAANNLHVMVRRFEFARLSHAIEEADGDRRLAARNLGIGLSTLYRKLEEYERFLGTDDGQITP